MPDPGGIDLILAVGDNAEEEIKELVAKAAKLRAQAAACDQRVAVLRQMHATAQSYMLTQRGGPTSGDDNQQ